MEVRFLIIAVNVHNLGSYFLGFHFFFNFIIYLFIYSISGLEPPLAICTKHYNLTDFCESPT